MQNFFTDDEMRCPCCEKMLMDLAFMKQLNMARWIAGFPFVVNSGYRCPEHNAKLGSTSENHVRGMAADIHCLNSNYRFRMILGMIGAGIRGIGIYKTFIHGDINRDINKMWIGEVLSLTTHKNRATVRKTRVDLPTSRGRLNGLSAFSRAKRPGNPARIHPKQGG